MNTQRSSSRYAKGIDDRIAAERYRKLRAWMEGNRTFLPCVENSSDHFTRVDLPVPLAEVANRIASQQHWTLSQAVVFLVKRGVKAQQEAEEAVADSHNRFMEADEDQR